MFGFALLAAVKPAYDDWLNERSSTPPVSRTMQALNFLPAEVVEDPPELELVGLLPHAAASDATATTAIVMENALRKGVSFGFSLESDDLACPGPRGARRVTLPGRLSLWAEPTGPVHRFVTGPLCRCS